jgi:hypothetical protein
MNYPMLKSRKICLTRRCEGAKYKKQGLFVYQALGIGQIYPRNNSEKSSKYLLELDRFNGIVSFKTFLSSRLRGRPSGMAEVQIVQEQHICFA